MSTDDSPTPMDDLPGSGAWTDNRVDECLCAVNELRTECSLLHQRIADLEAKIGGLIARMVRHGWIP